jgi:hypothetical protein
LLHATIVCSPGFPVNWALLCTCPTLLVPNFRFLILVLSITFVAHCCMCACLARLRLRLSPLFHTYTEIFFLWCIASCIFSSSGVFYLESMHRGPDMAALHWLCHAPPRALTCLILCCSIARHSKPRCTGWVMHLFEHFRFCSHSDLMQRAPFRAAFYLLSHTPSRVVARLTLISASCIIQGHIASAVPCAFSGCIWFHSDLMLRASFCRLGRTPS